MIIFLKVWSVDSSRKRQQSKNWGAITTTWKTILTCWGSLIPSSQIVKVKTCVVPSQLLSLPIRAKKVKNVKKQNKTNKKTVIDHVAAILTNIKFYCKKKMTVRQKFWYFYHRQMEIPVNRTLQSRNFQGQEEDSCPVCENHVCKNHGHPCTWW